MTFREAVEKIQACNDWRHCKVRGKMCYECRIDRIMEAYKAKVEEMPTESYEACKSYLLGEEK
jgi:hypothetical protein